MNENVPGSEQDMVNAQNDADDYDESQVDPIPEPTDTTVGWDERPEKSPGSDSYLMREFRVTALNIAAASVGDRGSDAILDAAENFLGFLTGGEYTRKSEYPMEQGDFLVLGEGIVADKNLLVINYRGNNYAFVPPGRPVE